MQIVKAGALYFALVFGTGFVLGTIRTLWVAPRFATRMAELMETPIMFVVTIVAARWIALHLAQTLFARPGSVLPFYALFCTAFIRPDCAPVNGILHTW